MDNILQEWGQWSNTVVEPAHKTAVLDSQEFTAQDASSQFELSNLRLSVAAALVEWANSSDEEGDILENGESYASRFDALMIGIVDADKNGEIDDEEALVMEFAYNIAAEFLENVGADTAHIEAMLNDGDEEAADAIHDLLTGSMPDGDEVSDYVHKFALGEEGGVMDAIYKKKAVVRNGKKVFIKKRISGRVRLSAKQKQAIKRAQRFAHSGKARAKRLRSLAKRKSFGMK